MYVYNVKQSMQCLINVNDERLFSESESVDLVPRHRL